MRSRDSHLCSGGGVTVVPFAPMPLCGLSDPAAIRALYDLTLWLDSLSDNCLSDYNCMIRALLTAERSDTAVHYSEPVFLPTSLFDFTAKRFIRQGWQGLPTSVAPLVSEKEGSLLSPLLTGLSTHFRIPLDPSPNLSREMCPTATAGQLSDIEKTALFIGGSNADRLANSAATLGINPETVTSGGWILSTANVSTILPEVEAYCATMPADSPVIIYCLDNSSFACADQDGAISAIRKLDKDKDKIRPDNSYHVVGELIVAHEITLAAAVSNLKRIIAVCGGRLVIIVTPLPRYLNGRCCEDVDHCTHIGIPEAREKIFDDLRRLHTFISSRLSTAANCQVVAAGDLLLNKRKAAMDETMEAYNNIWGTVHGNQAAYTRMAMGLTDILTASGDSPPILPAALPVAVKRPRSDTASGSHSIPVISNTRFSNNNSSKPYTQGAQRGTGRGFFRGANRGGGRGGNNSGR